jgi:dihydrofolate synthase/folylpolyglutamate synthase
MDPIDFLFSLERLGMKFGLDNITTLCEALGRPERAFRSVHIAGTNGKGSVTVMVETALRAAGHRAARYTSPHLMRLEERFVIDGREVETATLRDALADVQRAVESLLEAGRLSAPPTFFECATAAAFVLFRRAQVDIAVLEVGLGGRLDATNVVVPIVSAITSVDFDHEAQLGRSLTSIAREKGGIVKPGVPVVCGPLPREAETTIEEICAALGAVMIPAAGTVRITPARGGSVTVRTAARALHDVMLALPGRHQRDNAAVAVAVLDELTRQGVIVTDAAVRSGLSDASWPARLERLTYRGCEVLLDAAHNPAGARALASYLQEIGWTRVTLLFGAMQDKDVRGMLGALAPFCARVVCTTAPTPRAAPAAELAASAHAVMGPGISVDAIDDPAAALRHAIDAGPPVVAAGSIFLIGPLRDILR